MKLWDDDMEKARPTIRAESREFVERMQSPEPATGSLEDRGPGPQGRRSSLGPPIGQRERPDYQRARGRAATTRIPPGEGGRGDAPHPRRRVDDRRARDDGPAERCD